jgi:hypothetical protein
VVVKIRIRRSGKSRIRRGVIQQDYTWWKRVGLDVVLHIRIGRGDKQSDYTCW